MSEEGKTLVSAIHHKYDSSEDGSANFCQIYVPKNAPGYKGDEGRILVPHMLALENCQISSAGNQVEIADLCCKVEELDLTENLLRSWKEVFCILDQMPSLRLLNLMFNKLEDSTFPAGFEKQYSRMSVLILNGVHASWDTIHKVLHAFPNLTEFHLSLNNYTTVDLNEETSFQKMCDFHFHKCSLSKWKDVQKLGHVFPSLESLNILRNKVTAIDEAETISNVFPCLKNLNVSEVPLQSWDEIDKLRQFPKLTNLRISGVPFMKDIQKKERRDQLIARLPGLTYLNGSRISDGEREDAERAFIRLYMVQDEKPSRYAELEAIHGKLDPLVELDMAPKDSIALKVVFEDKEEMMDIQLKQTVKDFKKLLQNFSGLSLTQFHLVYVENFEGVYKTATKLNLPNKTLLSLNLNEGDEFQIWKK